MAPKHPYHTEADKGAFLGRIDDGMDLQPAAKRARIPRGSAQRIKKHSDDVQNYNESHNLPPPSMHDRVAIKPKPGPRRVMSETSGNRLKEGIEQDRKHREMKQHDVAQELGITGSISTVRREMKARNVNRVKPTKKLALTPIIVVYVFNVCATMLRQTRTIIAS